MYLKKALRKASLTLKTAASIYYAVIAELFFFFSTYTVFRLEVLPEPGARKEPKNVQGTARI